MMPKMYTSYRLLLYIFLFVVMTTLYPSPRSSTCISFFFCICFNKFITNPCKNMGKNIKSYATIQVHSPGKGREALRQKVQISRYNMVRLNRTYYSLFKLQAKFSKLSSPVKFQRITQIPRSSPTQSANYAKFAHFTLCFRHLPRQRTLQNSSELRKFHAIRPHSLRIPRNPHILLNLFYIMFQAPASTENTQEFQ